MIFIEDTQVKVGNVVLPGLFKSMDITTEAQIDEQEVEGSSKKKKQAAGYGDAKITIELVLEVGVYETAEYKLQKVQNLFKQAGQDKPIVHNIISGHLAARGISKVVFKSLNSKESSGKSAITASLEFVEWSEMSVTATKATAGTGAAKKTTAPKAAATSKKRSKTYQRGDTPKMDKKKKEKKSPAKDNTKNGRDMAKRVQTKYNYRR